MLLPSARTLVVVAEPGSILLVDDDRAFRDAVGRALRLEGYRVALAADGREALKLLSSAAVDLIILDVSMPMMGGIEVCHRLRAKDDSTSILMLTARDAVPDRIKGLDAGADDYLVKPFALDELMARVRAGLRRRTERASDPDDASELCFLDLRIDLELHEAYRGDRRMDLTHTEFVLLDLLLRNPRRVLTREVIFERVWDCNLADSSKVLDVYVSYLRRKTEAEGEPRLIHTVRSVGYVLRELR